MPRRNKRSGSTHKVASALPFAVHPQIGEAVDDEVTPIMRPTLGTREEREYQTRYELTELKRKLRSRNTLPMPQNCVLFLRSVLALVEGEMTEEEFQSSVSQVLGAELQETILYCARQKWLNSWDRLLQLTHEGLDGLTRQLEFNAAAGKGGSWPGLTQQQKTYLVLDVARVDKSRTVLGLARAVAARFQPPANAKSIRSWLNRNDQVKDTILRGATGRVRFMRGRK